MERVQMNSQFRIANHRDLKSAIVSSHVAKVG
jgi:hypothetical protein